MKKIFGCLGVVALATLLISAEMRYRADTAGMTDAEKTKMCQLYEELKGMPAKSFIVAKTEIVKENGAKEVVSNTYFVTKVSEREATLEISPQSAWAATGFKHSPLHFTDTLRGQNAEYHVTQIIKPGDEGWQQTAEFHFLQ